VGDRNQPQEPDRPDDDIDLGNFRGVVLDDTVTVQIVSEPPSAPAQPPSSDPEGSAETQ